MSLILSRWRRSHVPAGLAASLALGLSACSDDASAPGPTAPDTPLLGGECTFVLGVQFKHDTAFADAEALVESVADGLAVEYDWISRGYHYFRIVVQAGTAEEHVEQLRMSPLIDIVNVGAAPFIIGKSVAGVTEADVRALVAGIPGLTLDRIDFLPITASVHEREEDRRRPWIDALNRNPIVDAAYDLPVACP